MIRYLHYLLSALDRLPKEPESDFYRGVGPDAVRASPPPSSSSRCLRISHHALPVSTNQRARQSDRKRESTWGGVERLLWLITLLQMIEANYSLGTKLVW